MTATRVERDSLGPVNIAADKLWGAQTQRSLEHFSIGDDLIPREMMVTGSNIQIWRIQMGRNVADVLWEMLQKAGVKRCYGIVGDALNPVIDALRRNGNIDFVHVRNEEYGVFEVPWSRRVQEGAPAA